MHLVPKSGITSGITFSALALLCLSSAAQRPERPSPSRPEPSRPAPSRPAPEVSRPAPSRPAPEVSRPSPSRPAPEVSRPAPSRPAPEVSRPAPSHPEVSRPQPETYTRPVNTPVTTPTTTPVRNAPPTSGSTSRQPEAPEVPLRRVYDNTPRRASAPSNSGSSPGIDISNFGSRPKPTPIPSTATSGIPVRSGESVTRSTPTPIRTQAPTREEILKRYSARDQAPTLLPRAAASQAPAPARSRSAGESIPQQPEGNSAARIQKARAEKLARLESKDPVKTRTAVRTGEAVAIATNRAMRTGIATAFEVTTGCGSGWTWWDPCNQGYSGYSPWWHCGPGSYFWANGCTYWMPSFGWTFSFGWCSSMFYSSAWYWNTHCAYYYPGYTYWGYSPWYYTNVIYVDREPDVIVIREDAAPSVIEVPQAQPAAGEVVIAEPVQPRNPEQAKKLARVAEQYLALGDLAFRERRYTDAVSHYARAIEFAPGDAVLYLVLSDALFAAGDYHYAAFALKKSLELEPRLIDTIVDKHSFYTDPADFDKQLGYLERFLADHPEDDDARLVLAANYLFGNKPNQALELLRSGLSANVRALSAGQLLLERAEAVVKASPFHK